MRDAQRRVQTVQHPSGGSDFETFAYRSVQVPLPMAKTTMTPTSPYTSVYKDEADNTNGRVGYIGSISVGQVTSHTLVSTAVETRVYDTRHRLTSIYNSVDGIANAVEYTYYDGTGVADDPVAWTDLPKTVRNARARDGGAPFSAKFEYNSRQQITKVTYPATDDTSNHPFVTYEYDNYGRCTKITNELGFWTKFFFDDYGRCVEMQEQLDAPSYDGATTVASRSWYWGYTRWNGYITFSANAHTDRQWHFQIDPPHNAAGECRIRYQHFDVNQRLIESYSGHIWHPINGVTTPSNVALTRFQYDVQGNRTAVIDPLNRTTTTVYDLRNRPVSVTDPLNQTTTTAYNTTGQKTLLTFPDSKTQQFLDIDAYGQPWRTIDERSNTTNLEYQWGPMKKLFRVITHRDKDAGGTEDQETRFEYDAMGRERFRYFAYGTAGVTVEENQYEKGGELWKHKMRRGRWQIFTRDVRSRETGSSWDIAADAGLQPVTKIWDAANRLTSIANNVATIAYTYDKADQVLSENNYIAGGTGSPGSGLTTTYRRYPDGTVSQLGYPNGVWIQRNYNARGELTGLVRVDGSPWTVAEFYYYLDGKPSWTNRGNGTSSRYFYDGKGNLNYGEDLVFTPDQVFNSPSTVLTLGESLVSGRYTLTLQSGGNLVLTENGVQRWASYTSTGNQLVLQSGGNLVLLTAASAVAWQSGTAGNSGATFRFMNDGNLTVFSAAGAVLWQSGTGGQMAQSLRARWYARDNRDRLTAITKGTVSTNAVENGRSDRFFYDFEGQLTDAYYDAQYATGTPTGMAREDRFVYDQLGNRKANDWLASMPGWWSWTRRDNGLNQVKNWALGLPANWDDQWGLGNGNLIQDGNFTAWYNALNQPMWFATNAHASGYATHLAYDPLGRCVKRWTALNNTEGAAVANNPATYYYYEGWNLIQEGTGTSTATQIYVHGARVDEIVARYHYGAAKWYFHHYDARTHCQLVTTNSAAVAEQYAYDAFGWPYMYNSNGTALTLVNGRPASAIGNRFLFTGREWLTDWGIYDYRHRQYHPGMGRFLQPDPKHFGAGDYNLYRYCHNDPINKIDPTGLKLEISNFVTASERTAIMNSIRVLVSTDAGLKAFTELAKSPRLHTIHSFGSYLASESTTTGDVGVKSDSLMIVPTDKMDRKVVEGKAWERDVPAAVWTAHEFGHALSFDRGTQKREEGTFKNDTEYLANPGETSSHALELENAVRKSLNMDSRERANLRLFKYY